MTIRELPHNEYLFTPYSFGRSAAKKRIWVYEPEKKNIYDHLILAERNL